MYMIVYLLGFYDSSVGSTLPFDSESRVRFHPWVNIVHEHMNMSVIFVSGCSSIFKYFIGCLVPVVQTVYIGTK